MPIPLRGYGHGTRRPIADVVSSVYLSAICDVRSRSKYAARVLTDRGRWACLPALLRVASSADSETAAFAEQCIAGWFTPAKCSSLFIRHTAEEREHISAGVLGQVSSELLNRIVQTMKWLG